MDTDTSWSTEPEGTSGRSPSRAARWLLVVLVAVLLATVAWLVGRPAPEPPDAPVAEIPAPSSPPAASIERPSSPPPPRHARPEAERPPDPGPPPDRETRKVRCPVQIDGPVPERSALKEQSVVAHEPGNAILLILYTPPEHPDRNLMKTTGGWVDGSGVTFYAPPGTTTAWVKVDGYQQTELPWTGEGCDASDPPTALEAAVVTGTVDPAFGDIVVVGCPPQGYPRHVRSDAPVDASGRFRKEVPPGPCRLRAWRRDGTLSVHGPWVDVSPTLGEVTHAELTLPEHPQGILGVWTEVAPGGMVVDRVLTGSPAYEAGLRVGDLITAIDGVPTADMGHDDWVEHHRGDAGTRAVLDLETSWGSERVEVRRASPEGSWLEEP